MFRFCHRFLYKTTTYYRLLLCTKYHLNSQLELLPFYTIDILKFFRLMIIYCPLHWLKEVLLHDYFFIQWATNKHLYLLSFHTSIEFRMGKTIEHWLLKYLLFAALFHLQMESEMGLYIRMLRLSLWVYLATCLASTVQVRNTRLI